MSPPASPPPASPLPEPPAPPVPADPPLPAEPPVPPCPALPPVPVDMLPPVPVDMLPPEPPLPAVADPPCPLEPPADPPRPLEPPEPPRPPDPRASSTPAPGGRLRRTGGQPRGRGQQGQWSARTKRLLVEDHDRHLLASMTRSARPELPMSRQVPQVRKSRQADRSFTASWPDSWRCRTPAPGAPPIRRPACRRRRARRSASSWTGSGCRNRSRARTRCCWSGPPGTSSAPPPRSCRLALSPVLSMQLEFSSQSTEQEGPQLPLQLLSWGHSRLQLLGLQGPPVKPQVSVAQFAGAAPSAASAGAPASIEWSSKRRVLEQLPPAIAPHRASTSTGRASVTAWLDCRRRAAALPTPGARCRPARRTESAPAARPGAAGPRPRPRGDARPWPPRTARSARPGSTHGPRSSTAGATGAARPAGRRRPRAAPARRVPRPSGSAGPPGPAAAAGGRQSPGQRWPAGICHCRPLRRTRDQPLEDPHLGRGAVALRPRGDHDRPRRPSPAPPPPRPG